MVAGIGEELWGPVELAPVAGDTGAVGGLEFGTELLAGAVPGERVEGVGVVGRFPISAGAAGPD